MPADPVPRHRASDDHAPHSSCSCGHAHVTPIDASALISGRGLTVARGGRQLLSGVDLDVKPGEIVTLIGPNGGGKTTLVRVMLGIEKPDSGHVVRPASTRVGYVPQRFEIDQIIPMTVEGFLKLGNAVPADVLTAALEEVGVARTRQQQLSQLSGGETQRVLIARALLRDPNLLVLDEPARGVDFAGEADLYNLIGRLRDTRRLGVLLVSHDLYVVMANSDRVICLNGHVCCSGRPETVSKHPEYARLFGPREAKALGVYLHHHDHRHDLSGAALPLNGRQDGGRGDT